MVPRLDRLRVAHPEFEVRIDTFPACSPALLESRGTPKEPADLANLTYRQDWPFPDRSSVSINRDC